MVGPLKTYKQLYQTKYIYPILKWCCHSLNELVLDSWNISLSLTGKEKFTENNWFRCVVCQTKAIITVGLKNKSRKKPERKSEIFKNQYFLTSNLETRI